MKICGIELKSGEARIVVLENTESIISIVETSVKKITLKNDDNQSEVLSFKNAILNFFKDYDIEKVAIKQRAQTGTFSGSGITFKMETLIQLYEKNVSIINAKTIASKTKDIDLDRFTVNSYQLEALKTALAII